MLPPRDPHEPRYDYLLRILRTGEGWAMDDHAIIGKTHCTAAQLRRAKEQVTIEPGECAPGHPMYRPGNEEQLREHLRRIKEQIDQTRDARREVEIEASVLELREKRLRRLKLEVLDGDRPPLKGLGDGEGDRTATGNGADGTASPPSGVPGVVGTIGAARRVGG